MKKTLLFAALFSMLACLPTFAQQTASSGRAGGLLDKLAAGFRTMKSYEVAFAVTTGDHTLTGSYVVEGEKYYLTLGDAEVFCDGATRFEVDNRRREVTITTSDNTSRNILNNPAHAFEFLGSEYTSSLLWEKEGKAAIELVPKGKTALSGSKITVIVSVSDMQPRSISYDYEGEQVLVTVRSVAAPKVPLKTFDPKRFAGYEFIDFR